MAKEKENKSCCNWGDVLEALDWINTNKKTWAALFIVARIAPMAIIRAVAEIRRQSVPFEVEYLCLCGHFQRLPASKCSACDHPIRKAL